MSRPAGADWDAQRYHRVAQPHAAWGASVLDRLVLRGDECVLDAGCGSGTVTGQLLERQPHVSVIGVDVSPAMLGEAGASLARFGDRVRLVQSNLLDLPSVLEPGSVDAILSTATFHWIEDHPRLFKAMRGVVRSGGMLVAQYGGGDNLAGFMRATDSLATQTPYAEHLQGKALWRFYSTPEQTHADLEAAGFTGITAWLEPSPQSFADAQALGEFARAVVLRNHLGALPNALHAQFIAAVVEEIRRRQGGYVLDYVRLNVDAIAA